MKDARDPGTAEMTLVPKRGRGRPSTGKAKSAAERMREYRSRNVTVNRGVLEVALGNASQVESVSFQVDAMDQLAEENRQLRDQVDQLRTELANVTIKVKPSVAAKRVVQDALDALKPAYPELLFLRHPTMVDQFGDVVGDSIRCVDDCFNSAKAHLGKLA